MPFIEIKQLSFAIKFLPVFFFDFVQFSRLSTIAYLVDHVSEHSWLQIFSAPQLPKNRSKKRCNREANKTFILIISVSSYNYYTWYPYFFKPRSPVRQFSCSSAETVLFQQNSTLGAAISGS